MAAKHSSLCWICSSKQNSCLRGLTFQEERSDNTQINNHMSGSEKQNKGAESVAGTAVLSERASISRPLWLGHMEANTGKGGSVSYVGMGHSTCSQKNQKYCSVLYCKT